MADVLGVVIAKSFLVAHRFDPQHHIDDRAEQQGHDITVVILLHFFGFTVGTLRFDLANQTAGAMPLVGGKRFPAVNGHAAQRSVTVAKGLVSLRFADHVFDRSEEHTSELQSRLHLVCRLLLEKKQPSQDYTRQLHCGCSLIWALIFLTDDYETGRL